MACRGTTDCGCVSRLLWSIITCCWSDKSVPWVVLGAMVLWTLKQVALSDHGESGKVTDLYRLPAADEGSQCQIGCAPDGQISSILKG